MGTPVIIDAVRTPIGKRGGSLAGVGAPALLSTAQRGVLARVGVEPGEVDQIVGGCVTQAGQQASNVARNAWLSVGDDFTAAATTIDCQCGSGLQANNFALGLVATGGADIAIACGVEQMSQVPLGTAARGGGGHYKGDDWPWDDPDHGQFGAAERIAEHRGITRADIEWLGLRSQQNAALAWDEGRYEREIVPVVDAPVVDGDLQPTGDLTTVTRDQGLRETTAEGLAKLKPIIAGGIHTAGTSSQISDGAAAVLWMDEEVAAAHGVAPRARIRYHTMVGTDPRYLLDGPVDATAKMLDESGLTLGDFDIIECNEAFAAVVMSWAQVHEPDMSRVNVNGGAIALGHPVGCTGSRFTASALHELERIDGQLAYLTRCQGGSLGIGVVLERI
jgi:acetyl-CoA C-acetyltransferase